MVIPKELLAKNLVYFIVVCRVSLKLLRKSTTDGKKRKYKELRVGTRVLHTILHIFPVHSFCAFGAMYQQQSTS